ncbi:alpha/beta hydrolase fold domain-containing protein [Nocardiopsis sp. NPDC049922]|uniref:alpha/beta hydrolase fold domain-containing protein n=1 Tax=Nocardiopsis sp. NPDC049922 TaxID=3155157 RepID=UPI0033F4D01A
MASLAVRVLAGVLRPTRRRPVETVEGARRRIARAKADPAPPGWVVRRHGVTRGEVGGFPVYTVRPRRAADPERAVVYLHGGSYVGEIGPAHWALVSRIADAGCRVEVPVYGLAPRHTHRAAFPFLTEVHRRLLDDLAPERIGFAGDSAGAGLALALAQSLPETGLPLPARLVLVSPWVDATLTHPSIPAVAAVDPMLSPVALLESARAWAGGDDLDHPRISPVNGPMAGLPPTDLYIGTRDLFHGDVLRLHDALLAAGTRVRLDEAVGAIHVHPLTPTPEGRRARRRITAALRGMR